MPEAFFTKSTARDSLALYTTFTFKKDVSPSKVLDSIFASEVECVIDCSVAVQITLFRAAQLTLGSKGFDSLIKHLQQTKAALWIGKSEFLVTTAFDDDKPIEILSPKMARDLKLNEGDVVYFKNTTEYSGYNPNGLLKGQWAVHLGKNIFGGLFDDHKTHTGPEIVSLLAYQPYAPATIEYDTFFGGLFDM